MFDVMLSADRSKAARWTFVSKEYRAQAEVTTEGTILVAILFGPNGFLAVDDDRADPIGRTFVRMDERWGLQQPPPR